MNITSPMASQFGDSFGFKQQPKPSKKKMKKWASLHHFWRPRRDVGNAALRGKQAVPNHPANVNDSRRQISGYTTGFSYIASSFVLFFILLPFVLKKKNWNMNVLRFSFHDPWTVIWAWTEWARYSGPLCGKITILKRCEKIAPWTDIGDGPITGYFIYNGAWRHDYQ